MNIFNQGTCDETACNYLIIDHCLFLIRSVLNYGECLQLSYQLQDCFDINDLSNTSYDATCKISTHVYKFFTDLSAKLQISIINIQHKVWQSHFIKVICDFMQPYFCVWRGINKHSYLIMWISIFERCILHPLMICSELDIHYVFTFKFKIHYHLNIPVINLAVSAIIICQVW